MSFSIADLAGEPQTNQSVSKATPSAATPEAGVFSASELADPTPPQTNNDPRQTGEIVNDVGNKVIVPKDGESFSDTMKRAVVYHQSLTPEQQKAALDAETKTIPAKTAQTLAGAATIGTVGPALLALPGEIAGALPSVLIHTVEGVKALGVWAEANPYKAFMLYQVARELLPGAKKAMGLIKSAPTGE